MKKILLLSILLSTNAFAEWTNPTKINWLRAYPGTSTGHFVSLADKSVNEGCSITQSQGIVYVSDQGGRVYSAILAAIMAGKEVKFSLSGCTDNGYAKVNEVHISS